jgi:hypothetical protein
MPLFYLLGLEELEPRSPGEAVLLGLLRCLLDGMLAALIGSSLLLWVVTRQERAREREGKKAATQERDEDGAAARGPLGLLHGRFGPTE